MTIRHVPTPLATASCLALACLLAAACATQGTTPKTSRHTTPQAVLTTPLTDAAWQSSQWIAVADAPVVSGPVDEHRNGRAADGASWFVSTVRNEQRVTSARWMTTALGIYELFVNGQSVGKEILKPGFTHPTKTRRSFTYDITPLLKKRTGECNELAIQVTPGWWADKIVTPSGHEGMVGGKCAFRGVLELTYADGSRLTYPTDPEHWRATIAGPVTHAAIFDGEEYDARQQFTSLQPSQFSVPEVSTAFSGDILPTSGAEVYLRHDLALQPQGLCVAWCERC